MMIVMLISTISANAMFDYAEAQVARPSFHTTVQIFDEACPNDCGALALERVFAVDPFCKNVFFDGQCDDELASFTAQCLAQSSGAFCVGGEFLPIDSSALLVAGAQTNAVWIFSAIAVIGSMTFGALYLTSRRN